MPESDPLQILLAHDRWATAQFLDACDRLTADQFRRRFHIGPGSLHDTLTHMLTVMRILTDTLAGREPQPRLDADARQRGPQQLRAPFDDAWQALAAEARRRPLDDAITRRTRDGRTLHMTRAAVLTHLTTHNMHHRAQCLNILRQLGLTPLPPSSVAEWTLLGEPQP